MPEIVERDIKWDVDERFVLPSLDNVVAGGQVEHDTLELVSKYYDTPERDLLAYGITVRRCSGDTDGAWQVKIPGDGGAELRWPTSDDLPAELAELLTGASIGKRLDGIATIHTVRQRYRIKQVAGTEPCVQVVDDHVRGWSSEVLLVWREIEVEYGSGTASSAQLLNKRFAAAGARPSRYPSKVAHVCPPEVLADAASPAARAVKQYITDQIDRVVACDVALRHGDDPLHDCRVAIRRLRSTLRVFGKLLLTPAALDADLQWFAGLLGDVCDCQVQQRRFSAALDELPAELVLGPVKSRVRADLRAVELPARNEVGAAMNSERYLNLMTVLRHWRSAAPVTADTASEKLRERARRAYTKADRRLKAALATGDSAMLHRARKAAKRARYAAELLRPVDSRKRSRRMTKHYKRIQRVLGAHQDSVVAANMLRPMGTTAGTRVGENGFTYGLLYAREDAAAAEARQRAAKLR